MGRFVEIKNNRVVAITEGPGFDQHHEGSVILELEDADTMPGLHWEHIAGEFIPPKPPPAVTAPEPRPKKQYKSYTYQLFLKVLSDDELELLLEKKNGPGRPAAKIERFLIRLEQRGIDFNQPIARNALAAMVPGIFADTARIDQIINND